MHENDISFLVRKAIFKVYNVLGPGLYEPVYLTALCHELKQLDLIVNSEVPVPMIYEGKRLEVSFRMDLLVNEKVIIEIKSIETIADVHHKQLITYL